MSLTSQRDTANYGNDNLSISDIESEIRIRKTN